ncbi:MAG: elongation factor G [Candidatus Dormibacteria bacterium]
MTTVPAPQQLRSVVIVGHSHDGKTSLAEALLHTAGAIPRLGSTDAGSSLLDSEPEEQHRSMSIVAAVAHCDWDGHRINLIDAPGFQDFGGEMARGMAAADGALLVVSAGGSVPVGAELAWEQLRSRGLPTLVVVNKMDKDNAAYEATVDALRDAFARIPIAVAVPIGSADGLRGFVDLVDDRAYEFAGTGGAVEIDLPEEMRDEVERAHVALVEAAAETDDGLIERYLSGEELGAAEVRAALHVAALQGRLVPIVCAAATSERGAGLLLDSIVRYLPGPQEMRHLASDAQGEPVEIQCDPAGPLCAQVFKTSVDTFGKLSYFKVLRGTFRADLPLRNARTGHEERMAQLGQPLGKTVQPVTRIVAGDIGVALKLPGALTGDTLCGAEAVVTLEPIAQPASGFSAALVARSKGDEDRISAATARLHEEDPCFIVDRDPMTGEVLAHGLGDVHLEVALERMRRKYGVDAELRAPRVAFRETVAGRSRVQHKHKKQSGGAGLYGDCTLEVEPLPRGEGYAWEDKIYGGAIPHQFRPSVEKGVRQTIEQGAVAGYPIVDIRVRLVDGSTHPVDGKDIAFQIAGAVAMRKAVQEARPTLLEPVMAVQVVVPDRQVGEVITLLTGRRGHVGGMNPLGDGRTELAASVPQAEMYSFPTELRAVTQGRGRYSMRHSHYDEVPAAVARPLIDAHAAHTREHAGVGS